MVNIKKGDYLKILLLVLFFSLSLGCSMWLKCRNFCINLYTNNYSFIAESAIAYSKKILVIFFLYLFFKLIKIIIIDSILKKILQKLELKNKFYGFSKLIGFGLWTVFVLISLSILISNVTALIASLGLVGFGLTFALQKPILNFVGWLVLIFKRIYSEGDRIRIGSISGDVKEIQVMNTVLDGLLENSNLLSGKIVTFPNELVLTSDVENYTKESNYIREELSISITFESNYHKAVKLLKEIITVHVRKNKEKYIKKVAKKTNEVNVFINKMLKSKGKTKKQQVENDIEAERLKKEKEQMENELKDIDKEFIPKIRVELLDSSIQLIAQFLTPYNHIKKNRTEINLAFLDAIRKEKDIEIAYPHMQVIQDGKK